MTKMKPNINKEKQKDIIGTEIELLKSVLKMDWKITKIRMYERLHGKITSQLEMNKLVGLK